MAFSWTIVMLGCLSLGIAPPAHSATGDSQTPAASKPALPTCNAPLPDEDTVSRYRSLAAADKGRRLIEAAKEGAAGEVRALLAAGADVGSRDKYRSTALHRAAREGHVDVASCLLASGAEVDARNFIGETPLHVAAWWGRTALVRLLTAAGADPNARHMEGRTPLHSAVMAGQAEAAAALLEAGADKWLRDGNRKTPLDFASNQQLIHLLVKGDSQTPAASKPAPPACNAPLPDDDIVSFYRSLAATDKARRLFDAATNGAADEVRALLAAGADVNARDLDSTVWGTALHWATGRGHADVASCLLASGAEVDARDVYQQTPLHYAARNGDTPLVRLLVAAGADPNARQKYGTTPLQFAVINREAETAAALLEAGADKGQIPLDQAPNQQLRVLLAEG